MVNEQFAEMDPEADEETRAPRDRIPRPHRDRIPRPH